MRTYTVVITGEAEAARVAIELTHRSQWFTSEPMPDDQWEITVKQENEAILKTTERAGTSASRFIADRKQLLRLLDEAHAVLTPLQIAEMSVSMDLTEVNVNAILDEATAEWEAIKDCTCEPGSYPSVNCDRHGFRPRIYGK